MSQQIETPFNGILYKMYSNYFYHMLITFFCFCFQQKQNSIKIQRQIKLCGKSFIFITNGKGLQNKEISQHNKADMNHVPTYIIRQFDIIFAQHLLFCHTLIFFIFYCFYIISYFQKHKTTKIWRRYRRKFVHYAVTLDQYFFILHLKHTSRYPQGLLLDTQKQFLQILVCLSKSMLPIFLQIPGKKPQI